MIDRSPRCLVLDAMGVVFAAAADVAEILIPFIRSAGGESDARTIESVYLQASLGIIDADAFWRRVGQLSAKLFARQAGNITTV